MLSKRGRKAKPGGLKIIEGNRGHNVIPRDPALGAGFKLGNINPPIEIFKRKLEIWNQRVRPCPWLTPLDARTALLWVFMAERLENGSLSKNEIAHYRSLSSCLGFDPSSRVKLSIGGAENIEVNRSPLTKLVGKRPVATDDVKR